MDDNMFNDTDREGRGKTTCTLYKATDRCTKGIFKNTQNL